MAPRILGNSFSKVQLCSLPITLESGNPRLAAEADGIQVEIPRICTRSSKDNLAPLYHDMPV